MRLLTTLAALAWVAAASVHADEAIKPGVDYHSFANVNEFRVKHVSLDLDVSFQKKELIGHADLTVLRESPSAKVLVLDTRDLDIRSIVLVGKSGATTPLAFKLGAGQQYRGRPLDIDMPPAPAVPATRNRFAATEYVIRIDYSSQPQASGLQWLTPTQTNGKKLPYMFSQNESVHARSWIPLQDSPQIRVTYDATIRVPKGLVAVMSAAHGPVDKPDPKGLVTYHFEMSEAIPSYLIAIAVGDLKFHAISQRTGVYAEPGVIDAAAAEFSDLERMVAACETLFGPYRWGRYDLLILPPSAPYGGMENPRLSFITPTVIAGDKSLVSLIAHELAHSWSGNLVTNATWRDFWLNEGFTVYLERRILETLYGKRREQMEDVLGLQSLRRDLADADPAHQQLAVDLRSDDPDDGVTDIAYEKGKLFLQFLENRFGREPLQAFLRSYFDHFAFQSIYTEQFLDYLRQNLLPKKPGAVTEAQIHEWVYGPGIPSYAVLPAEDVFAPIDAARKSWLAGSVAAVDLPARGWTTQEWLQFLDNLPKDLPRDKAAELDRTFTLSKSHNAEIAMSWFRAAIRADYEQAYPDLRRYLLTIGRIKLVRPLYEELMKTDKGAGIARATYSEARPGYHPLTATVIDPIVHPKKS